MRVNTLFRRVRFAQDSGDYPIPVADAAEKLPELRAPMLRPDLADHSGEIRYEPKRDASFCCDAHEELLDRLRAFGGASAVGENVAAAFERRIRELDAQCPKAVTP